MSPNVTTRWQNGRRIWWPKKEAAYADVIEDGESGAICTVFDGGPWKRKGNFQRGDQTGRGHDWHDEIRENNGWSTEVSRSEYLDTYLAAMLASFGLGTSSSASAGSGGYRHTCKPLASSSSVQLPSTTMVEMFTDENSFARKYSGICVNDFTISGDANSWAQASYNLVGSGAQESGASVSIPSLSTARPLLFGNISVANVGASGATDLITRLRSYSFKYGNALQVDKGYTAGSTIVDGAPIRSRLEFGDRKDLCSLELVFERKRSSFAERTDFEAGTSWAVTLTLKGALIGGSVYQEVKIVIPIAKVEDYDPDFQDQAGVAKAVLMPHYDTGISAPVKVEIVNTQSALLATAA